MNYLASGMCHLTENDRNDSHEERENRPNFNIWREKKSRVCMYKTPNSKTILVFARSELIFKC